MDYNEFYLQIKELIGIEEDHPEAIINKIQNLFEISQAKIDENEKLRVSTMKLNENYHRLEEEHEKLIQSNYSLINSSFYFAFSSEENIIDQSIQRLINKLGLSSGKELILINPKKISILDSSSRTQIDEICNIFDTFCFEYCQSTSTNIETVNLIEIFQKIQFENTQLKMLINQIDLNEV
jgi:hypothetical protein